jgi:transmembrane sensor
MGTSFNMNTYRDEDVLKTTLLEGSIRLNKGAEHVMMKPGQQALIAENASIRVRSDANMEEAIAWKNGLFTFEEASVPAIMRQLSRWYNVDVVYEGAVPGKQFVGKIFREMPLNKVLKVLGNNGISCRIEGRKILVAP